MTGYVRNDIANNIQPNASAQAEDIDGEFDAIVAAFHNANGHTHDGTAAEGAPITVVGPSQNVTVTADRLSPTVHDTVSLGSTGLRFSNAYFTGNIVIGGNVDGRDVSADGAALDQAETDINSLESRMTTAEDDIDDIKSLNTTQNSRLTSVENVNSTQNTTLSSHGSRLTAVENKNTTQDNTLSSHQSQINALTNAIINKIYPVGSLYISSSSTNPGTILGVGTWSAYGQGRALVGVGTADGVSYGGGTTRGTNEVTLSTAQLPSHNHGNGSLSVSGSTGNGGIDGRVDFFRPEGSTDPHNASGAFSLSTHSGVMYDNPDFVAGSEQRLHMNATHNHSFSANVSGSTASTGSGSAHTNIQPSIGVYVWRRTA